VDLQLAIRVLWRFKLLVITGLVLAFGLAFLSMVRVSPSNPHLSYRAQPSYESLTTVFVTSHGFPWGSLKLRAGNKLPEAPRGEVNTSQLRDFATVYLQFAASNQVKQIIARDKKDGGLDGTIQAFPVFASDSSVLPLITLSAISNTPERAYALAHRHLAAFKQFLEGNQTRAGIAPDDRVILQAVNGPEPAHLLAGRKKTKSIMVFLAVMVAVCGLAFILENLRPRIRPVASTEQAPEQLPGAQITRPAA
jgi:hypothetical protein